MSVINLGHMQMNIQWDGPEGAPIIIFSNSLGTDLGLWDEQVAWLSQTYRCLRYDKRGHGSSSSPVGPYSIQALAEDVIALMAHQQISKASFVGLSIGGMTGQWLAAHHGDRFDKIVLANTSASAAGSEEVWNARIKMVHEEGMDSVAQATTDRWFTKDFQAAEPNQVERIMAMVRRANPEGYIGCVMAIRDMDLRACHPQIKNPTLVIAGEDDTATPPALGQGIAEAIDRAELALLKAPHISNIESQAAFDAVLKSFLE